MILLVVALALIFGALVLRSDRTMPAWVRGAAMAATLIVVAAGTVYALAVA